MSSIPASDVFWNNSTIGDDLNNVSSGVVNIPLPHEDPVNISDEEGVSSIPAYGLFLGDFWDNRIVSMEIFIIPDDFYNVSSGVVNIPLPHVDSVNMSDEEGVSSILADVFLRG